MKLTCTQINGIFILFNTKLLVVSQNKISHVVSIELFVDCFPFDTETMTNFFFPIWWKFNILFVNFLLFFTFCMSLFVFHTPFSGLETSTHKISLLTKKKWKNPTHTKWNSMKIWLKKIYLCKKNCCKFVRLKTKFLYIVFFSQRIKHLLDACSSLLVMTVWICSERWTLKMGTHVGKFLECRLCVCFTHTFSMFPIIEYCRFAGSVCVRSLKVCMQNSNIMHQYTHRRVHAHAHAHTHRCRNIRFETNAVYATKRLSVFNTRCDEFVCVCVRFSVLNNWILTLMAWSANWKLSLALTPCNAKRFACFELEWKASNSPLSFHSTFVFLLRIQHITS